jgi:hypothetical protein
MRSDKLEDLVEAVHADIARLQRLDDFLHLGRFGDTERCGRLLLSLVKKGGITVSLCRTLITGRI